MSSPSVRLPFLPGFALMVCLAAGACASAGEPIPEIAAEINATLDPYPTRCLPGDTVDVRFANADETPFDQTVLVDQEGSASFLLIGRRNVLGKSPELLEQELREAYSTKLQDGELSVNIIGVNPDTDVGSTNRPIHVLGEVRSPGSIPYVGSRLTLVEALARGGSFDKRSALLKHFGSIDTIRAATVEELAAVPGMTRKAAEQLKMSL
jgi:protein involved in polysaccharide export with SLBB domain